VGEERQSDNLSESAGSEGAMKNEDWKMENAKCPEV
jgi:hypothetical protein